MRKSAYAIAALAAIVVAAPSIASADSVVIKHRDNWRGAHAEYREHRDYGWHTWLLQLSVPQQSVPFVVSTHDPPCLLQQTTDGGATIESHT